MHVNEKRYGVKITAGTSPGGNPSIYYITGLRFETYVKWRWYFEYRAALYKVNNPRHWVDLQPHQYDYIPTEVEQAKKTRDAIVGKKAQITKWTNAINAAKENWNELFPIEEDPQFIKACGKLEKAKTELQLLNNQLIKKDG